jgi:putative phage-type endonuclease
MKIIPVVQKTKSWLDYRSQHICASDANIIMEVSPFKSIDQLYKEKLKNFEQAPNPWMQRGNDLESIALAKFEQESGLALFPMVGEHDKLDWMAASFDGVKITRDAIVEIKCPGKKDHAVAINGMIPKKYFPQIQHQIEVAGVEFCYYFSFDGENGVIIEVPRNQLYIDEMIDREFKFWETLQIQKKIGNEK